ncbi:DUF3240 family protein [Rhodopseudomonas palustris]|nr:DUF3240 family protein [Rhodopseudomonas palustris]
MSLNGMDIYFEISNKDILVDFLLAEGYNDFYYFPCKRYGAGAFLVSAQEQVSARAEFGLFRLFLEHENAIILAESIKNQLIGKTIRMYTYGVSEL